MGFSDVWVVIAAYNEGTVLSDVVRTVRAAFQNVVVVDDGSSDDTAEAAASAGAVVVRHPINLGQGAALQTGIDFALRAGADAVVTFDADGQHRVEDAQLMLERLWQNKWDVAIGSRFLGSAENIPPIRRMVLRLAALFTWATAGVRLTDAHNGLRAITAQAARKLRIRQNRMAHASEIIEMIGRSQLRVGEVPVKIIYTEYSLAKGQKLSNSIHIVLDLLMGRIGR
ncbi:glycosyltransferase family 2 protein [Niveibacterium umoris]|uniref:Glycosyltransferase involved in cell wall biosynthesis n=1 Tax=Niveibacterium umoris TaxID=1193620 RepID=A0A840BGX8_9RHOO|nr:glycosyltransferase family 2 protein [Niveibacterium umoris]MBB4012230.1 glycosyltransferase involved in cell wall biosynthesis [Niveibacterium umoris]